MNNSKEMIFGIRAVIEAVQSGAEIDKILIKKDIQSELSRELMEVLRGRHITTYRVPVERLNRITKKNHQGVVAYLSQISYTSLGNLVPTLYEQGKVPFIVVLDGITDIRNFGAIARTCDCAGVDAVVIPARNSVTVNADAVKTSAGALMTLPVCKEQNIDATLDYLHNSGFRIVAATEKGDTDYTAADYTQPTCLLLGAEDKGIPNEHLRWCDDRVSIPQLGTVASLNVSVAAGILIYEAVRQRRQS
ncbi:MAG TPA: 23S rRNA (guanosine(2251)-2'-O)-methyltransferase RlmB [Candidatus Avibacteroides faecavium]|nr:23S rRNA (guanosine(2251)-2'-O)-methyltransferase RlmB [Candidatus Avibacteroides faecavium]